MLAPDTGHTLGQRDIVETFSYPLPLPPHPNPPSLTPPLLPSPSLPLPIYFPVIAPPLSPYPFPFSASDSFTTMALYKFTYLLTYLHNILGRPQLDGGIKHDTSASCQQLDTRVPV